MLCGTVGTFTDHLRYVRQVVGPREGVRTLAGYASTSRHGEVRFVISLRSNNGEMRFQLLRAIQSAL